MLERIHEPDPELVEIPYVPSRDRQPMHHGGRGDHGVLDQGIRAAMPESLQFPEHGCTHREDVAGGQHGAEPGLQFLGLGDILLAGELDACLYLADRYRGQKQFFGVQLLHPADDRGMRMKPAQFRYDVRIKQVHDAT